MSLPRHATSDGEQTSQVSLTFLQWLYSTSAETGDVAFGNSIRCHSLVLQWRKFTELERIASRVRPEVLSAILKWAYAGGLPSASMDVICEMYQAANEMKHADLLHASTSALEVLMAQDPACASSVLKFSDIRNLPELGEICVKFLGLDGPSTVANLASVLRECTPKRAADILLRRSSERGATSLSSTPLRQKGGESVDIWVPVKEACALLENDIAFRDVVHILDGLLDREQDPRVSALTIACFHADKDVISRLLAVEYSAVPNAEDADAMLKAVLSNRTTSDFRKSECLSLLIANGAACQLTTTTPSLGTTVDDDYPLHTAACMNAEKSTRVLIDQAHGDVGAKTKSTGRNPFHEASASGAAHSMRVLLEHASEQNLSARDNVFGSTPLHLAAQHGHFNIIELILSRFPAVVDIPDFAGRTPLHRACGYAADVFTSASSALSMTPSADPELAIKSLLGKGAKASAVTDVSTTPLHWLCGAGGPSCVGNVPIPLRKEMFDIRDAHVRCVEQLLGTVEGRGTVPMRTMDGSTALHIAVRFGFPSVAHELVVAGGADVNTLDSTGASPLTLAMHAWTLELVARALIIPLPIRVTQQYQNTNRCERCSVEFTVFLRPHHCRNCAACVCGSCSKRSLKLNKFETFGHDRTHRVCDWCFDCLLIAHHAAATPPPPVLKIRPAKLFTIDG